MSAVNSASRTRIWAESPGVTDVQLGEASGSTEVKATNRVGSGMIIENQNSGNAIRLIVEDQYDTKDITTIINRLQFYTIFNMFWKVYVIKLFAVCTQKLASAVGLCLECRQVVGN